MSEAPSHLSEMTGNIASNRETRAAQIAGYALPD